MIYFCCCCFYCGINSPPPSPVLVPVGRPAAINAEMPRLIESLIHSLLCRHELSKRGVNFITIICLALINPPLASPTPVRRHLCLLHQPLTHILFRNLATNVLYRPISFGECAVMWVDDCKWSAAAEGRKRGNDMQMYYISRTA